MTRVVSRVVIYTTHTGLSYAKFCQESNGARGFSVSQTVGEKNRFFWDGVESKHRLGKEGGEFIQCRVNWKGNKIEDVHGQTHFRNQFYHH